MNKFFLLASVARFAPIAFMSDGRCETVLAKIKGGSGDYVRVNASDVEANPDNYTVSDKKTEAAADDVPPATAGVSMSVAPGVIVPPAPSAPASLLTPAPGEPVPPLGPTPPTVPAPDAKLVKKDGKVFKVVHQDGTPWTDIEGIDEAGYKTEQAAWDAILALPH